MLEFYDIGQKEGTISKKRFTTEQIVAKLREAEVLQTKGRSIAGIWRGLIITEQTHHRWVNASGEGVLILGHQESLRL